MKYVGDAGYVRARPSSVKFSGVSARERLSISEDVYVTRMTHANEAEVGVGAVQLKYDDTISDLGNPTAGDLPCHILDVTDMAHKYQDQSGIDIPWYCRPCYVLNFFKSTSSDGTRGPFFRRHDWVYEFESYSGQNRFQGVNTGQDVVTSAGQKAILDWADIRLRMYGVQSRNVKYTIQLVRLADHLSPNPSNPLPAWSTAMADQIGNGDMIDRFNTWFNYIKPEVSNDILPRMGGKDRGFKVIKTWRYNIKQKSADNAQVNKIDKKIFLKIGKVLNHQWRKNSQYASINTTNLYTAGFLDDPSTGNVYKAASDPHVSPGNRLYLIIKATCPKSISEGANIKQNSSTAVALSVPRTLKYEAPIQPIVQSGDPPTYGVLDNSAVFMGRGVDQNVTNPFNASSQAAVDAIPVPSLFQTVDEADRGTKYGQDVLAVHDGAVDNVHDVRGTAALTMEHTIVGVVGQEYSPVWTDGLDIPTYDFVVRIKYRIPN